MAQVHNMRHQIELYGETVLGSVELQALTPETSGRGQWEVIAQISIAEGWSFTFFPNGDVRFAKLSDGADH